MTPTELQHWRSMAGLSQAGLAVLLGVDKHTVSRWERGNRGIPPFLHLALKSLEPPDSPMMVDGVELVSGDRKYFREIDDQPHGIYVRR